MESLCFIKVSFFLAQKWEFEIDDIIMEDTANNVNVGDVITLKAKVLSCGVYRPVDGYVYRLLLMSNSGLALSSASICIPDPADLLDKEKPATCPAFRPLKAGDIAKCVEVRNRKPNCGIDGVSVSLDGEIVTVITNETDRENNTVDIKFKCGTVATIDPVYLDLCTPVEELKPYYVETGGYNRLRIKKGNLEYSYFPFGEHCVLSMDEAKAAAEAECDRLNEDWRKRHQYCDK